MVTIRVKDLSKVYRLYDDPAGRLKEAIWRGRRSYHRDFWALKDVSFEVAKGKTLGIIGRNGSGKSTLLELIARTVAPTYGQIEIFGRVSALLELGTGFDPNFTGRENVYMNGAILGLVREEIDDRFEEIERFAGIGDFMDQPVKLYSNGMYVRLAFATAINVDPDVLLVDEALAVGDTVFQHRCMSKIREIQEQGKTIAFVSHDLGAVKKLCTEAILLERGEMLCMGTPEVAIEKYNRIIWNSERDEILEGITSGDEPVDLREAIPFEEVKAYDRRFGNRKAEIIGFALTDEKGKKREAFAAGAEVLFSVAVKCHESADMPLASFLVKDLIGNDLFGANTDAECYPLSPCPAGSTVQITFSFVLPHLRPGSYALTAAFGNGTLDNPSAYDWVENICVFTAECHDTWFGLIRTPTIISQRFISGHD
ncbi:MAG: ABC transporter ATP-binding protein [Thermodesulfobacteriota bacterium]|nr:ABC transporter ATP-binding protein [Thermodesulfobacteriota bacterium]